MKKLFIHYLIIFIFSIGLYGASGLVLKEYQLKQVCPQILSIPACYIIILCLFIPLIAHIFKFSNKIYFAGTGIALIIASYGSITHFFGFTECPITNYGTPMCYLSFLLFLTLVILKWFNNKTKPYI